MVDIYSAKQKKKPARAPKAKAGSEFITTMKKV